MDEIQRLIDEQVAAAEKLPERAEEVVVGPPEFLNTVFGTLPSTAKPGTESLPQLISPDPERPYVTLTFAQSLDAKIAGKGGVQLMISGPESMKMTHWMRTMHDGILIGIGTAVNDNPQLNVRHLPFPSQNTHFKHYHHPRPIIVDQNLRLSKKCKLVYNASLGAGVHPWIVAARPTKGSGLWANEDDDTRIEEWEKRKEVLEAAGAKVILIERHSLQPDMPPINTDLDLPSVLRALRSEGIKSIMVEGGAKIIQSFLSTAVNHNTIDTLVVTTAPGFIGRDGVGYGEGLDRVPGLRHFATEIMGKDTVIAMKMQ